MTTGRAIVDGDLLVEAGGWHATVAIELLVGGGGPVPVRLRERTGDGCGDGALLGVMLACASRDAVGDVIIELT